MSDMPGLTLRQIDAPFLQEPFEVRDGAIHIPDRPGASIAWNADAVKRYVV